MKQLPKWITIDQAAEYMQVNPMTVRRWIKAGKLPASNVNGLWRIDSEQLEKLMEGKKA